LDEEMPKEVLYYARLFDETRKPVSERSSRRTK
jgi:hypothetical protein